VLEIHAMYSVDDTTCATAFTASKIVYQLTHGRLMIKFPEGDGKVISSDVRNPGVGLDGLKTISFANCHMVYVRQGSDG
jgi:hypothetical protein